MRTLAGLFLLLTSLATAQTTASVPPFSKDEIAIYRHFLTHYQPASDELSNIINMDPKTVAFSPGGKFGDNPVVAPRLEFNKVAKNFGKPAASGRILPPNVLRLTEEKVVVRRIAAAGKLIDPSKLAPWQWPDGWGKYHFTLSEIVFDAKHHRAAFKWSADCSSRCGNGGTVIYRRTSGHWKFEKTMDEWQG